MANKKKKRSRPDPRSGRKRNQSEKESTPQLPGAGSPKKKIIAWSAFLLVIVIVIATFNIWVKWLLPPENTVDSADWINGSGDTNADDDEPVYNSPREEFEAIAERISNSIERHLGTQQVPMLRDRMQAAVARKQPVLPIHVELCRQLLRLGDVNGAVAQVESAMAVAPNTPGFTDDHWKALHQLRALVYLRQAEVENCIARHNRDCCLFPLSGGGIHTERAPATKARESILEVLKGDPNDLSAKWLLNITAMAMGDYPDGLAQANLIPPAVFESEYDVERFVDIAGELGLDTFNLCGGVIVDDFDGDHFLDIVTSTYDPSGPLHYFRNEGNGSFADLTREAGLDEQLGGLNLVGADYDNDGDTDILVLRGAWLHDLGQIRNSLLRNNGDGTFTDITHDAGMANPARPTQAAVWGDFDNDGWLDLFIGNESRSELENGKGDYPSQLFKNNGDGTFTDIAERAGVTNDRYCKSVTAGDYDNDGDLDLYVSNVGPNRLYQNDGSGKFKDIAEQKGVTEPAHRSFACWFFDYNNDGWLDLFVAAYDCDIDDIAADYLGQDHAGVSPRLYENDGKGGFVDVTNERGLNHPSLPMGANFGDIDNDGWQDIYLGTGDPDYETLMPNVMYRNDAGQRFQNVTTSGGFGHLQKGHGVAFADIDHDGDQDVFHQLGGFYPGDKFRNALFKNPGNKKNWLSIKLVGVDSNRMGYGARISVTLETPDGLRTIHRAVGSVSSFGGSPARQEIGLGNFVRIVKIEVEWPVSGIRQQFSDIQPATMVVIQEDQQELTAVELQPIDFPDP